MSNFYGVVIEESLESISVLGQVKIISTRVEAVIDKHQTPWLHQWTLHDVEIPAATAADFAEDISNVIRSDEQGSWYADFKDDSHHYIVFSDKIFKVDRISQSQYDEAKQYGLSLGIPEHQVDFHPDVEDWDR